MAKKKPASKSKTTREEAPPFEESLAALEKIVADLESGSLSLSDAIQQYEQGVKLLKQCHGTLDQVQRKIELLTRVDKEGQATTVPFDGDGTPADKPVRGKSESVEDVDESGRLF